MSLAIETDRVHRVMTEDCRRGEFLRAVDAAVETMSDWEARFIKGFVDERAAKDASLDHQWFTDGRRRVVDNMIHRYGFRSTKPPLARVPAPAREGCCNYLTRHEGRLNVRCGEPAVTKLHNGLELCQEHLDQRTELQEKLRAAKRRMMRS